MGGIISRQRHPEVAMNTAVVKEEPAEFLDNVVTPEISPKRRINHVTILLHPYFIHFLDFEQLSQLCLLNNYYAKNIKEHAMDIGYWQAMCTSLSARRGLYCPQNIITPKDYFFRELWQCNRKWLVNELEEAQNFRICVSSRFRPGPKNQSRFALPLHQFLKVRSQQLQEQQRSNSAVFVGEAIPPEYLDPLLGTLMTDPVLLPDSQRVVNRSVAMASNEDPFTNNTFSHDNLIALPGLAQEIAEFKLRQLHVDISVASTDVMSLVKSVDPRLLEAIVAIDQVNGAVEKARYEATHITACRVAGDGEGGGQEQAPEVDNGGDDPAELTTGHVIGSIQNAQDRYEPFLDMDGGRGGVDTGGGKGLEGMGGGQSRWAKAKHDTARLVDVCPDMATVTMNVPGTGIRPFNFNQVFPDKESQVSVYRRSARDIVVSALNGTNGCVLCYGQTGSGKTHTMFGPPDMNNPLSAVEVQGCDHADNLSTLDTICDGDAATGIVMRTCAELLRAKLLFARREEVRLSLTAQFVEIYNETITDLMTGKRVTIRRANGEVNGAAEVPINSIRDAADMLKTGNMRKHFAATAMNDHSSRSHTALIMHVSQTSAAANTLVRSTLYLVDLAGSERVKKSKAIGTQFTEARAINYSLLVLGKVIARLSRSALHVPYYESQLTTMLKGAFGGNCRTSVVVTCRSDDKLHGEETLQSLRFGEHCGMISNKTRQAASSVTNVVKSLEDAIAQVTVQMDSLRSRGKSNIPSFLSLESKLAELRGKKDLILSTMVGA